MCILRGWTALLIAPVCHCAVLRARRERGFPDQRLDRSAKPQIIQMTELLEAELSRAVDQDRRRRALHLVGAHGLRQSLIGLRINADGEVYSVFVQESRKRLRAPLRLVMLKHRVQTDHCEVTRREGGSRPLRLRQAVADAAGAQHLEGDGQDHPAAQRFER